MRTYRCATGPLLEQPYFKDHEVDEMCSQELRRVDLLPNEPGPIRIEKFIERRFGVTPSYDDLPGGVVGLTRFGEKGVVSVQVSRRLVEEESAVAERRVSSTLAHEAGHGLMHAHLFAFQSRGLLPFQGDPGVTSTAVMCREDERDLSPKYHGRWWELQANMAIGALLLPTPLIDFTVSPLLVESGNLGTLVLNAEDREKAIKEVLRVFNVNAPVARYRLERLYPLAGKQPCL